MIKCERYLRDILETWSSELQNIQSYVNGILDYSEKYKIIEDIKKLTLGCWDFANSIEDIAVKVSKNSIYIFLKDSKMEWDILFKPNSDYKYEIESVLGRFYPRSHPNYNWTSWTGWLSPKGKYIPSEFADHANTSAWVLMIDEKDMDDLGWVRCDHVNNLRARSRKPFTRSQMKWLSSNGYLIGKDTIEYDGFIYTCRGLPMDWRPDTPVSDLNEF